MIGLIPGRRKYVKHWPFGLVLHEASGYCCFLRALWVQVTPVNILIFGSLIIPTRKAK